MSCAGAPSCKTRAVTIKRRDLERPEIRDYVKATRPGRSFQHTNDNQTIRGPSFAFRTDNLVLAMYDPLIGAIEGDAGWNLSAEARLNSRNRPRRCLQLCFFRHWRMPVMIMGKATTSKIVEQEAKKTRL
jgi:hypothetical protein